MFLAGKAACAEIVFPLLATGISGPRPTKVVPGPNLSKQEPVVGPRTDILKMQETLRDKRHYRGEDRWGVRPSNTGEHPRISEGSGSTSHRSARHPDGQQTRSH